MSGLWPKEELCWSELDHEARTYLCMAAGIPHQFANHKRFEDIPAGTRVFLEMEVDVVLRGEFELVP